MNIPPVGQFATSSVGRFVTATTLIARQAALIEMITEDLAERGFSEVTYETLEEVVPFRFPMQRFFQWQQDWETFAASLGLAIEWQRDQDEAFARFESAV